MIGDSLAKLLGFDTNQLAVRTKIKNNEEVSLHYITPNYKDASGKSINYRQHLLKNESYYKLLPTGMLDSDFYIRASLKRDKNDPSDDNYISCSRVVRKGMGISFKGYYHSTITYDNPKFKFRVKNTGAEAADAENNGDHYFLSLQSIQMVDISLRIGKIQNIKAFIICMCLSGMVNN